MLEATGAEAVIANVRTKAFAIAGYAVRMPKVFEQDGYRFFFSARTIGPYTFTFGMEVERLFSR